MCNDGDIWRDFMFYNSLYHKNSLWIWLFFYHLLVLRLNVKIVEWKIKWIVPWTMYLHSSHYSLNGIILTKWLHLAILWSWEYKGREAFDFPQDMGKPRDTWINVWAYGGGRFYIGHSNAKTPSKNSKQINAKVTQLHDICGLQVAATSAWVR